MNTVGPLLGRDVLAVAFLLTAAWKITHRREYAISFTGLQPSFIREFELPARVGLIFSELACVGLLAAGPGLSGGAADAGPVLAIALLVLFTLTIAVRPSVRNCGCWSAPTTGPAGADVKGPLLARNAIMLAAGLTAVIPVRPGVSAGVLLSAAAFAAVIAPVLLELPQIIAVAKYQDSMRITGARS
jgi:hypothetical protein